MFNYPHQNKSSSLGMAPLKMEGTTVEVDPGFVDNIWARRLALEPAMNAGRNFDWRRKMARLTRTQKETKL